MFGEMFAVPYMGYLYKKTENMMFMWLDIGCILLTIITSISTTTIFEKYCRKEFKRMKEMENSKECPYVIEKEN